jgi:hypothetical protein
MPIHIPGDPPPNPSFRWLLPAMITFIVVALAVPFAVVHYHNSVIEENQNAVIDALREYARQQAAIHEKSTRYASSFDELSGNWASVRDVTSLQPTVYHGYRFRAFTSRAAKDGAAEMKFVDADGHMTGGYAIMAVPVSYGYTARLTFFISSPGDRLFYTDLGVKTDTVSRAIEQYFIPEGARSMKGI